MTGFYCPACGSKMIYKVRSTNHFDILNGKEVFCSYAVCPHAGILIFKRHLIQPPFYFGDYENCKLAIDRVRSRDDEEIS